MRAIPATTAIAAAKLRLLEPSAPLLQSQPQASTLGYRLLENAPVSFSKFLEVTFIWKADG